MTQLDRAMEAVRAGAKMRATQKSFFKTKDRKFLEESKKLEREFDKLLNAALEPDGLLG